MVLQLFRFCFDNWNCMDWTGSASWTEFPFVASNIDGNTSSQSRRSRVSYLMISLRCVQVHRSSPKYTGKYSLEHLLCIWYPGLEVTSTVLHCISWMRFLRSLTNTFGWRGVRWHLQEFSSIFLWFWNYHQLRNVCSEVCYVTFFIPLSI